MKQSVIFGHFLPFLVKVKELGFEKKDIKASFSSYETFVLGTGLKELLIL
jgi:hypothetical protein